MDKPDFVKGELEEALAAINSLIGKCEKAFAKLTCGTSQHTLMKRRLAAFLLSVALILREMNKKIKIYHFTKKENLESILEHGLRPDTKFLTLGSKLREGAVYFWSNPGEDEMGYIGNKNYVCLEVNIDASRCFVASMDIISAAFVNFVKAKTGEALWDYQKLAGLYDSEAMPYSSYTPGHFRVPEIIVQGVVAPAFISAVEAEFATPVKSNREIYNERLRGKLATDIDEMEKQGLVEKIAIHDDSTGLLASYFWRDSGEFFTVEL